MTHNFNLVDWKNEKTVPIAQRAYLAGFYNQGSSSDFPGYEDRWNKGQEERLMFDEIDSQDLADEILPEE